MSKLAPVVACVASVSVGFLCVFYCLIVRKMGRGSHSQTVKNTLKIHGNACSTGYSCWEVRFVLCFLKTSGKHFLTIFWHFCAV